MKRKSKKTFRGTAEQHSEQARRVMGWSKVALRQARKHLAEGSCVDALLRLRAAEQFASQATAEADWGPVPRFKPRSGSVRALSSLWSQFSKKCMR
jgi:hypothetical protein